MIQIDEHILQMGWFNHQLGKGFPLSILFDGRFCSSFVAEIALRMGSRINSNLGVVQPPTKKKLTVLEG